MNIKKVVMISMVAILFLSLLGCDAHEDTNYLRRTELTDRDKFFLSVDNSKYFIYDMYLDEETYSSLEIWVETYRFGEKQDDDALLKMFINNQDMGLILIKVNESNKEGDRWTVAVNTAASLFRNEFTADNDIGTSMKVLSAWGPNGSEEVDIEDREIVLGSILYSSKDNICSLPLEYYNDPKTNSDKLNEYDYAQIIKCRFYKKETIEAKSEYTEKINISGDGKDG